MFAKSPKLLLLVMIALSLAITSCGAEPTAEPTALPNTDIPPTAIPPTATVRPANTPIPTVEVTLCVIVEEEGKEVEIASLASVDEGGGDDFKFDSSGCATLKNAKVGSSYQINVIDAESDWTYYCSKEINIDDGQTYEFELRVPSCEWSD